MTYHPRHDGDAANGINLAKEQDRIEALRALLQDELRAGESNFDRAAKADNLIAIQEVLPTLADLYAVERTATGDDLEMRPILQAIGQRALMLIQRELDLREETIAAL